jgi:hypothetical protein
MQRLTASGRGAVARQPAAACRPPARSARCLASTSSSRSEDATRRALLASAATIALALQQQEAQATQGYTAGRIPGGHTAAAMQPKGAIGPAMCDCGTRSQLCRRHK